MLLLAALCFTVSLFGQLSIRGIVADGHERLPSVTILLLDSDSVLIAGVISNTAGEFIFEHLAPGRYLLSASMIGYAKFISEPILLWQQNVALPEIVLREVATELSTVVIHGERQLIDQKIDRMVINLESSISSSGNTLLEVLQKSPGIVLNRQNNTISLNGKSGVRIMVNEKIMVVPLDVALQMLDGMSASNVEKIELITSPPSKYDAEGNGGIIHIITKTNEDLGTSYSLGLFLGVRRAEAAGGNVNVRHRGKRFSYFTDYSISRNHNVHIMQMNREWLLNESVHSEDAYSHRDNITTQHNFSSGLEWKPGKNTTWSVLLTGYRRNWTLDAFTTDTQHATQSPTTVTGMGITEINIWQSATGSIGVESKVNDKTSIRVTIDYLSYHNDNPSRYQNNIFDNTGPEAAAEIDLKKTTPIRFLIGNVDYQSVTSPSLSWDAGIKAVASSLNNDVSAQRRTDNVWIPDPAFSSLSILEERVGAGYVSSQWNPGRALQINSGLRYEYTHTNLGAPDERNVVDRKYGYLFPSFSLKKSFDTEKDFHFSYNRRITRPTYNDIAPYVFFWGPNTFSAGNTSLYPAIADAVTAGYHVKQWSTSFQVTHSRNEIVTLQAEQEPGTSNFMYRSQNLKYLNTLAFINSFSMDLFSWWKIQTNLTVQYQAVETSHLSKNETLSMYGINAYILHQLTLPKSFSVELSGLYQSKSLSGIAQFLPFGSLNAAVQKNFGAQGVLRLSMDDILGTNNWRIKTDSAENNINAYFDYNWYNQFIRLGYTRTFGNNRLKSVKMKSGSEEERMRVN
jgi:hypothetical protein